MLNVNACDENTLFGKFRRLFTIHTILWLGLIAALSLAASVVYVYYNTTTQARLYADMVSMQLTGPILHEAPDRRRQYIDRIDDTPGIENLHVFVGIAVSSQYGQSPSSGGAMNPTEAEVLSTGTARIEWLNLGMAPSVRIAQPFTANGSNDHCMQCHEAGQGAVLGGLSMTYTAEKILPDVLMFVFALCLSISLIILLMRRLMHMRTEPLDAITSELSHVVRDAAGGNSTNSTGAQSKPASRLTAENVDQLMNSLHSSVDRITADLSSLMNYDSGACSNLEHACEMVSSLVEISHFRRAIEADETEQDIYNRFGKLLREVFDIQRFSIYEVDAKINRIRLASIDGELQRETCYCDSEILTRADACRIRQTGCAVDSTESDEKCPLYQGPDGSEHLCIPFLQSSEVGGVLQLVVAEDERARISQLRPIIEAYLREAGAVIEIKRQLGNLRETSLRDPLTGLYNRRFLAEFENTLVASIQRRLTHAVVIMLDIDHFKQVNDTYGHEAGDIVLKEIARILQTSVRSSDLVIRYGGEEFMLILMDAKGENGEWVAEKIRTNIESQRIALPAGKLQRTVSIGVADFPADSDDFWQCVKYADTALYSAKGAGRNRVERYFTEMWDEAVDC